MGTYNSNYNCTYKPPKSPKSVISGLIIGVRSTHEPPSTAPGLRVRGSQGKECTVRGLGFRVKVRDSVGGVVESRYLSGPLSLSLRV